MHCRRYLQPDEPQSHPAIPVKSRAEHAREFGTYFFGDSLQTEEDTNVINPLFLSQAKTRAQVFGAGWIWMPATRFTNQLRFAFNNFWQQILTDDHSTNPSTSGINTGVTDPLNF